MSEVQIDIDKKVLNILLLIFFGIFAVGIGTLVYCERKAGDCDRAKKEFYRFEYEGKIIRTFRSKNHGYWSVEFENGMQKSLLFDYTIWVNLKPGDILIKHKNELNFTIISGSDTTYHEENIPDCEQFREE